MRACTHTPPPPQNPCLHPNFAKPPPSLAFLSADSLNGLSSLQPGWANVLRAGSGESTDLGRWMPGRARPSRVSLQRCLPAQLGKLPCLETSPSPPIRGLLQHRRPPRQGPIQALLLAPGFQGRCFCSGSQHGQLITLSHLWLL